MTTDKFRNTVVVRAMSVQGQSLPKWAFHAMSAFPLLATRQRTSLEVGRSIDADAAAAGFWKRGFSPVSPPIIVHARGPLRPDGRGSLAIGRSSARRLNA